MLPFAQGLPTGPFTIETYDDNGNLILTIPSTSGGDNAYTFTSAAEDGVGPGDTDTTILVANSKLPSPSPAPTATGSAPPAQTVYWTLFSGDSNGTLEPHQVEYANTPLTAGSTYTDVSGTNSNMLRCTNAMAVDGSGHI